MAEKVEKFNYLEGRATFARIDRKTEFVMGLTMYFCSGDSEKIEQAIREVEFEWLDDPQIVKQKADFSLHLQPRDLNSLSRQFGKYSLQRRRDLRPYLKVVFDEIDRGVLLVDPSWVEYVAKTNLKQVDRITKGWFKEMKKAYPDEEINDTEEARKSVEDLMLLCKAAVEEGNTLVHYWIL